MMKPQYCKLMFVALFLGCCLLLFAQGCSGGTEPSPDLPLDEASLSIPVPDFLTADQQLLYRQAYRLYMAMFSGDTSEIEFREGGAMAGIPETVMGEAGTEYTVSQGRYSDFSDFDALVHAVFSECFWSTRPYLDSQPLFIESDGRMCYMHLAWPAGYNYYNSNFPDEFALVSKTDDEIVFDLIGHYSTEPCEGETMEELNLRRAAHYDYTLRFPMRLIRTEAGWRFDRFYSAQADQSPPIQAHTGTRCTVCF